MNKSIVFINQNSGYLMIDIIDAFANKYNERVLITGNLVTRNKTLPKEVVQKKIIKYNRTTKVKRITTWLIGFLQTLFIILFRYKHAHLFIVTNPPIAPMIPLLTKNSFSLLVFDIYPDALVEYNIFKHDSPIVRFWEKMNKKTFDKASRIFTISEGMKSRLSKYTQSDKVEYVPLWTDNKFFQPIEKNKNRFIKDHDLLNKFIVMYSGNLGYVHNVESIVEIANKINRDDIVFVIIGEGDKKRSIQKKIEEFELKNCLLLPWQSIDMFPHSLSAADLGIVSLGIGASLLSVPSKTFNLMSVGVPILALCSSDAELNKIVSKYNIGASFLPTQFDEIVNFIENIVDNPGQLVSYKQNSLNASKDFTPKNAQKFL